MPYNLQPISKKFNEQNNCKIYTRNNDYSYLLTYWIYYDATR